MTYDPLQRRHFITLLGGAAAAWPLAASAQQPNSVKRIGWLVSAADQDPRMQARDRAFQQELAKLGWTVGQNVRIDHRTALGGDDSRARTTAMELVATDPDVIVATSTQLTAILQQQTSTIPIVFVQVADPVESGLVASFARPGGNITGFTSQESSFIGKWLSILKDIAPGITRVMVLYSPDNPSWIGYLRTIEAASSALRVNVSAAPVKNADEVARQIEPFAREPGTGMIVLPSGFTGFSREQITALAAQHRLPAIYPADYFAESGGLVSYGSDSIGAFRQAASYVDRILRGTKPADLPVQAPVKFELVINLKAAKAIGIEVPYNVLVLADKVIDREVRQCNAASSSPSLAGPQRRGRWRRGRSSRRCR
jgi:putative ABC transport system substrate-binding protein